MKNSNSLSFIIALQLMFGLSISSLTAAAAPPPVKDPIQIGSILILSGDGSSWGNAARNGLDLAVERINAAGGLLGRRIVVHHQDDQGDPKKSIAAFRQLVDVEGVRLIIGTTWSNLGIPLIDMAARAKVLMISPSLGMAKFNESSEYLFNTWPHDYVLSQKLADYVFNKGHRNVALIGAEHVWVREQTDTFKARFQELGGRVGYLTEPLPGATDGHSEALQIKNTPQIEAIVSTADGMLVGSLVAKALKELKVKFPIYSITMDQAALDASQGGFEGLEFLTFLTPTPEYRKAYEARFKTTIDIGADSAYDALMLLAQAIRTTGSTDPTVLAGGLAQVKEYDGVSGHLVSDGKRGFTKQYTVKRIAGGKPVDL